MSETVQLRPQKRVSAQAGYSLIELMIVVGIAGVLTGIAVVQIGSTKQGLTGDGGMRTVLSQMNQAREMAITQRRYMRISFTLGNKVTISKEDLAGGAPTEVQTALMEGRVEFLVVLPVGTKADYDTPEGYGNTAPVLFPTATGTPPEIKFSPEGTLVNQDGKTLNGTVFLAVPNQKLSARAVTVFGSTGRVRGYRWDGAHWKTV
jgi:prepilin-type N-terminal cleavage/methylation domain-containing protein